MPLEKIGDVELHYEVAGDGPETVAFVNGVAMTVRSWQPQRADFVREFRCLFHDTRGQLLSEKPAMDYSMQMHADDLKNLLDHLGLERVHVVGTSYGSEIGMIFAYSYPEAVKSLTVITGVSELDEVVRAATGSWAVAASCGARVFYRCMVPWVYSSAYIAENREELRQREELMARLPPDFVEGFIRLVRAFSELDITGELHRITCPTLVVAAENDLVKPPRFSRIIHENIPGSELVVIPGSGHAVVLERPDLLNPLVRDFITKVSAKQPAEVCR
jgi:3-oxoadipate enol-lactonase